MRKTVWMPLYLGDYLRATAGMPADQCGAYANLIVHYWLNGPLPSVDSELRDISRMSWQRWRVSCGRLLRDFELRDHAGTMLYHHADLDALILKRDGKIVRASAAARKRWGLESD